MTGARHRACRGYASQTDTPSNNGLTLLRQSALGLVDVLGDLDAARADTGAVEVTLADWIYGLK